MNAAPKELLGEFKLFACVKDEEKVTQYLVSLTLSLKKETIEFYLNQFSAQ